MKFLLFLIILCSLLQAKVRPKIGTYLGDRERNYYGDVAPDHLKIHWRLWLGSGQTLLAGTSKTWKGAGWTGQPLVITEDEEDYLIQPSLDHHLRKIRLQDRKIIWKVDCGDSIKGTPTFADLGGWDPELRYVLLTGSRRGSNSHFSKDPAFSLRAISYLTGRELWRMNVPKSHSNSRDVDASPLMFGKKAIVPLENGDLAVIDPRPWKAVQVDGHTEPLSLETFRLYTHTDLATFGCELSNEGSPTRIGRKVYFASGCGRLYSYPSDFSDLGWNFQVGGDLNCSMPLTSDDRLLVGIERQFISGQGGVMKVRPGKTGQAAIDWFYPLPDDKFYEWNGGVVGSVAINDRYRTNVPARYACFIGVDGSLTLIDHKRTQPERRVRDPLQKYEVPIPLVLDQVQLPAGSISTPLFLGNRIVAAHDQGIELYEVTPKGRLVHLAGLNGRMFDATPTCWNRKVYAASRDGYLYCLGN